MAARAIKRRTKWKACTGLVAGVLVLAFAAGSGQFLVVDMPGRSDVIVVLSGGDGPAPTARFRVARPRLRAAVDPRRPCGLQNLPVYTTGTSREICPGTARKQIDHYLRNSWPLDQGDPREFGVRWWRHREWAKTNFYEWLRLAWWELIDRWR